MNKFALTLPGGQSIPNPTGFKSADFTDLGSIISSFSNIVLFIAFFLAFFWSVWGIFQYIFAGGNKENLASARRRIIWALVGLAITAAAFAFSQYAKTLLPVRDTQIITPVSKP